MLTGGLLQVLLENSAPWSKGDGRALFKLSALSHPEIQLRLSLPISLAKKHTVVKDHQGCKAKSSLILLL